jgi:hypothetical protein
MGTGYLCPDVIAGFTVTITAARRNVSYDE